jgi:hypothetical protein
LTYNAAERLPVEIPESPHGIEPLDGVPSVNGSPSYQSAALR